MGLPLKARALILTAVAILVQTRALTMTVTRITVSKTEDFGAALEKAMTTTLPLFILFTGAKQNNGISWCPDCVAAEPIIEASLAKLSRPIVFLECPVLREEYRGNSEYTYRTHPTFKLACVPTLIRMSSDYSKVTARLDDSQSQQEDLVEELINGDV